MLTTLNEVSPVASISLLIGSDVHHFLTLYFLACSQTYVNVEKIQVMLLGSRSIVGRKRMDDFPR